MKPRDERKKKLLSNCLQKMITQDKRRVKDIYNIHTSNVNMTDKVNYRTSLSSSSSSSSLQVHTHIEERKTKYTENILVG